MFIEICLAIIASALVTLIIILAKVATKTQESIHRVQVDLNRISIETTTLLNNLNEFISHDLSKITDETGALVEKLTDLTSDISDKSHSLNFLFKPFSFLRSKLNSDSPSFGGLSLNRDTIPQLLKWIATSVILIKTTRGFLKKL